MFTPRRLIPALLAGALLVPSIAVAQSSPAIITDDYLGGSSVAHSLTATVPLRNGISTSVKVVKDLIDLVPFELISITGGQMRNLANGRTAQGKGFIVATITPSNGVGSQISLKVGLHDVFKFKVVNRGEISSITKTPDPTTIQAGTPWVVQINGVEIGGLTLNAAPSCHSFTEVSRSATSVRFSLTKTDGCNNTTSFSALFRGTGANDPQLYVNPQGVASSLAFSYAPPPPVGLACTSDPNLQVPIIRSPSTGSQLTFQPATTSPVDVLVRWDSLTVGGRPVPLNEWIVTARVASGTSIGSFPSIGVSGKKGIITREVRGLQTTLRLALPDTHTVTVRPKNCGQNAPSQSVTFGVIRQ